MNNSNGSNKMNYVLIAALCIIAAFAMFSAHAKTPIDSSTWGILTMIVGGFLTLLEPNNHKNANGTSVQVDSSNDPAQTNVTIRTPPSGGSGVTSSTLVSPSNPLDFPNPGA